MSDYKKTVGIEVHCELKTATKMFSSSCNGYGESANVNINLVDLGYPGTLPTINDGAVTLALRACLALNCKINQEMFFDRKNYFYPDLPKGYQITQARTPIGVDGYVEITHNGEKKKIRIHDIHMEEDTAKSIHQGTSSYLDFNRAGVPLIEIVTEPDIDSDEEAILYLEKLRELLLYTDVSDCKIEEGSMRCDVNVSISKTESLGTRTEIKNIGSIRNVGLAINKEAERQEELLNSGETIREETRRYDDVQNQTVLMRVKEVGNDYRYFPEPDIPKLVITDSRLNDVKKNMPMLPDERRIKYQEKGLSELNSNKLILNRPLSDYFNQLLDEDIDFVMASNLLLGDISAYLNKSMKMLSDTTLTKERFISLLVSLKEDKITTKNVKDILTDYLESDKDIDTLLNEKGIKNISDTGLLIEIIKNIIEQNPASVEDYLAGKDRAVKFLMGQIMKETKGSANPSLANELLLEELKKQ